MKIKLVTVGKLKEKYLKQGIAEYTKRLTRYAAVDIIEVPDEKAPENLSDAEMTRIKDIEGRKILAKLSDRDVVFVLAIDGKQLSSEEFSKEIEQLGIQGKSQIAFVIGGSLGLSDEVLKRSDGQLSFGRLTYPHQLMRLVLVEQIYRAFRIMKGEPYHK